MKQLFYFSISFIILLNTAHASDDKCKPVYDFAMAMMNIRQTNFTTLPEVLQLFTSNVENEQEKALMREIVLQAWEQSLYDSMSIQTEITSEFANKHYLECIRNDDSQ